MLEKRAIKSATLGAVKSIKLSVAEVNTQLTNTVNPETKELMVPVGSTCDCACGGDNCFTPTGDCRCYGAGEDTITRYENDDETTDLAFSFNPTTIKFPITEDPAEPDAQALQNAIIECINSGEVAVITGVDQDGTGFSFEADSIQNGEAPNYVYGGVGPGSFSGKVGAWAQVQCGSGAGGKACSFTNCEGTEITWIDSITGTVLTDDEIATLSECLIPTSVEPECNLSNVQAVLCAAETIEGQATEGDQLFIVSQVDCNNFIVGSTIYNISTGNTEVTDAILTDSCDPEPDIETIRECILDTEGVQWTQLIIIDGDDPSISSELYYNENLELGAPSGEPSEWQPCPNDSGLVDIEKVCFEWFQTVYNGYAFAYSDGEVQLGLDINGERLVTGANVFCCDDCIQVFGCRDGRLAWPEGSVVTMSNGETLDIGGLRYTEVAQLIVDTYGGTFQAPSLGGPQGPNFSGCQGSSQHELQFYNVPISIESIDELDSYGTFGNCDNTFEKLCEIADLLSCTSNCPELDMGEATQFDGDGNPLPFPISFPYTTEPSQVQDFVIPFSVTDPSGCLADSDPSTLIPVRFYFRCHDLITGSNGTTGFNIVIDAASAAFNGNESATNTFDNSTNVGSNSVTVGIDIADPRDKSDRWVEFNIPLQDLLNGTTMTTSAFGGVPTGVTESLGGVFIYTPNVDWSEFGCEDC